VRSDRRRLGFVLLVLALAGHARADDNARRADLASFDQIWSTIRDKHWEPRPAGLDWDAVRDELRPRVEKVTTRDEARAVMEELLERLGQSHFALIPAEAYGELGGPGGSGTPGLDVRLIEGAVVVTSIDEGSAAAASGVRPGWIVDRVEREPLAPLIARLQAELEGAPYRELALTAAVRARLRGPVGESLAVRFIDDRGRRIRRRLTLEEPRGTAAQLGWLPTTYVRFEHRWLAGDVGYVRFNLFIDPARVMPAYNEAMEEFRQARGIVLDLRDNPGGILGMAMGMAGWFVGDKDSRLGTMYTRDNELKVVVFPRPGVFGGPLAVLVDGLSASCSEILAGGLRDLGRARVFGSRTMGAALPSVIEALPNGDGFQYAIANYVSRGGETLEGEGVKPDVEVVPTREDWLHGRDVALEAAEVWIREAARSGGREAQEP